MLRNILLGAGVFAALVAVLIFSGKLPIGKDKQVAQGEITMWGTIPEAGMNGILQQFNPQAETYRVFYREVREADFDRELLENLASGTGPDLILVPHQMILSNADRLQAFPTASLTDKQFKDLYVDAASAFWSPQGALALPVSIDPLVLLYNRALLSKSGIANPPRYWDEVTNMAPQLTIQDSRGMFIQSAIALGAPNMPHAKDVIMATVGQLGQTPILTSYGGSGAYRTVTANTPIVEQGDVYPLTTTVRFFTQFADPSKTTYTWSQFAGNADERFVAEKLAMYIGYASELETLRARNRKADFDMATMPQTRGYNTFVTGGRMYGIATMKASKNVLTSLTAQRELAGYDYSPRIAYLLGAVPALRLTAETQGVPDVIRSSMLVARVWYDSFPDLSTQYVSTMLADIINGRRGAVDAAAAFVSRLQDLYTPI